MGDKVIRGFLIKYALSEGIEERDGLIYEGKFIHAADHGREFWACLGTEFVLTREEGEIAARAMAKKKIASLRKQIAKLEVLAVTPKWKVT